MSRHCEPAALGGKRRPAPKDRVYGGQLWPQEIPRQGTPTHHSLACNTVFHIRVLWPKPSDQMLPKAVCKGQRESCELAVGEGGWEEAFHLSACAQCRVIKTHHCQHKGWAWGNFLALGTPATPGHACVVMALPSCCR